LSKDESTPDKPVVYSRNWICGFKCGKEKDGGWTKKRVKSCQDYMMAKLSYDMYEDIHQVANYCQIKYDQNEKKAAGEGQSKELLKKFMNRAKLMVFVAITMQIVLLYNLATEVLVKKIEPSGRFLFLRLVLMSFMIYIFNSEQTSITKTRYFIMVDKLHWDLKLANFMRYLLANLTFGIAMWQVFSTPDGEADVVGEIMDFAALLIVIELDDYLMSTPSQ